MLDDGREAVERVEHLLGFVWALCITPTQKAHKADTKCCRKHCTTSSADAACAVKGGCCVPCCALSSLLSEVVALVLATHQLVHASRLEEAAAQSGTGTASTL